jgi:hypothetical protein
VPYISLLNRERCAVSVLLLYLYYWYQYYCYYFKEPKNNN